jgi:putative peptide zinc metalloprotease protein
VEPVEPWVFPFDRPLPPAEGDNQAAAYNTTDDSATYDLAFALVWATGDKVLNVNEAHAYASCSNCVTVAVAFQVVLIMDDARVVVPQNLSVAANYQCYQCITAAIASQLVLSVQETPGQEQLRALGDVWDRLTAFGRSITTNSLTEISTRLTEFKAEIVAILGDAPPVPSAPTAAPSPAPDGTPTDAGRTASPSTGSTAPTDDPPTSPSGSSPPPLSNDPPTSPSETPTTAPDTTPPPSSPSEPASPSPTTVDPTPAPTAEPSTAAPQSPDPSALTSTSAPSPSP